MGSPGVHGEARPRRRPALLAGLRRRRGSRYGRYRPSGVLPVVPRTRRSPRCRRRAGGRLAARQPRPVDADLLAFYEQEQVAREVAASERVLAAQDRAAAARDRREALEELRAVAAVREAAAKDRAAAAQDRMAAAEDR